MLYILYITNHFSINKKNEGMIKCITDVKPDPGIINNTESNPNNPVSVNDINFTKPNSMDTRNIVRTI